MRATDGDTSRAMRTDDFLRTFRPTRRRSVSRWHAEPPKWSDYDFTSELEFERWSQLRYQALLTAFEAATRDEPGTA